MNQEKPNKVYVVFNENGEFVAAEQSKEKAKKRKKVIGGEIHSYFSPKKL